ncbi:GNAT family N-acetyltransferase [Liquorilactobacillus sicerae]|uniref:GNAT family N-acetyltransferase n=1 Tax=Liquorilactobacillus sicerae TaxID=1416943 RepID=UPI00248077D4|nr:GNAT family N-acetyltransferase [Liquorilactobacillus sicerae]
MKLEKLEVSDSTDLLNVLHDAHKSNEKYRVHFKTAYVDKKIVEKHLQAMPTFAYRNKEGKLVSTISVDLPWIKDMKNLFLLPHINWFATDPEYKNLGYGKKIMNEVIKKYICCELKAPAVTLDTAINHPWLKYYYSSLGFLPIKRMRIVEDHESIYMIKILNKALLSPALVDIIKKYKYRSE